MLRRNRRIWGLLGALGLATSAVAFGANEADRQAARTAIAELESNPDHKRLTAEPLKRAKSALERASNAYSAGDAHHGAMLDALAREWAESGQDLTRAVELEQRASKLEAELAEAETKSRRALALIEATVARRGRAKAELEKLQTEGAPTEAAPAETPKNPTPPKAQPKAGAQ